MSDQSNLTQPPDMADRFAMIVVVSVLLGLAITLGRVVQLQVMPSVQLAEHTPRTTSRIPQKSQRGDLQDRRGRVLATSRTAKRLFADPSLVEDPYNIALLLAEKFDVDLIALDKKFQKRIDSRYVILIPLLDDVQLDAYHTGPRIRGIGIEDVEVRHLPYGNLAAPLIGKVGVDGHGLAKMEMIVDSFLSGEAGELEYLRDVKRRAMWVEPEGYTPVRHGEDVQLSLDIEIQRIAREELVKQVEAVNAGGGRLVVLDPVTGELLAMTSMLRSRPDFDDFATDPSAEIDLSLARLRCVSDPYEPGSTFKPFIWAASTQDGWAKPSEVFDTHWGRYRAPNGRLIRDAHPYEELDWEMVLVKSSNIAMAQVATRISKESMQEYVHRFGFGQRTSCGFPGETAGIVTPPKRWNEYTQASVSFGQEIAVTPLQMVRAFAALAGDGTIPTIQTLAVDKDRFDDQHMEPTAWVERRAIDESIALKTRQVMHRVMLEGSGRAANEGALYRMFGKSGTAQLYDKENGGYHQDRYIISFIAGAPLDDPQIVVLCVIEDPDKRIAHYGGAVCGPVVRNVTNRVLQYMGVASDSEVK